MASTREIHVHQIAKTVVNHEEVKRWLEAIGADGFEYPDPDVVTDPAFLIALAGKRCYMSFQPGLNPNVSQIRKDYVEYFDNILKSGHGSVLEHAVFSYAIENVTRVFTGEMNRHRAGMAISEGSMRFIRFDKDVPYWLPTSLRENPNDDEMLARRKASSREIFKEAFEHQQECYQKLVEIWDMDESDRNFDYKKKVTSCLRRIIGMGCCTGGIWTGNVRALRHVFNMRCAPSAEEEILYVASTICADLAKEQPLLFGDFKQDESGFWRPIYPKV